MDKQPTSWALVMRDLATRNNRAAVRAGRVRLASDRLAHIDSALRQLFPAVTRRRLSRLDVFAATR